MNQNELEKSWYRMFINSYYGLIPPTNEIIYFKHEVGDKITKTGIKLTQELKDKIDNYFNNIN